MVKQILLLVCLLGIGSSISVNCAEFATTATTDLNFTIPKENRGHDIQQIMYNHVDDKQPKNALTSMNNKETNLNPTCHNDTDCLPWTYCNNNSLCECADLHHMGLCDQDTLNLYVLESNCITYDNATGYIHVGKCVENCITNHKIPYDLLPNQVSDINYVMCEKKWKRTGRLCGQCLPGYYPIAYSFNVTCVKCEEGNKNIWKLVLIAFGPLTLFYFFMLFFKIKATSSHLHGFLYFSQTISAPAFMRVVMISQRYKPKYNMVFKAFGVLYSMWNLDILRNIFDEICLPASTLTILSLDYALAVYPLLLTILSLVLIELHNRNYKVVVFLWKPFRFLFMIFRRKWDIRTTVIDTYATFFELSFVKVLSVSFDLLISTKVLNPQTGKISNVLYYDGTIDYMGKEHLPYAITAIVFLVVFTVIPTLFLLLYPFRWFRWVLNCLKLRLDIIHAIMDSFQGCYKNGTEPGTRDYRYFAAIRMLVYFILLSIFAKTSGNGFFTIASLTLTLLIMLLTIVQPYKDKFSSFLKMDIFFIGLLVLLYTTIDGFIIDSVGQLGYSVCGHIMTLVIITVSPVYMFCVVLYWMFSQMKSYWMFCNCLKARRRGYKQLQESENEEAIPDRLANPEQYSRSAVVKCDDNDFEDILRCTQLSRDTY